MVFHWSLSDNKFPQVTRTLLSIMADLDNAVFWMVTTRPLISNSSTPCSNLLVIVPIAPITNSITVTFMCHSFFQFSGQILVLISLFVFLQPERQSPLFGWFSFFFFFCLLPRVLVIWTRLNDPFVSQNLEEFWVSFSWTDSGLCIYHLFVWSNLNFLHNFRWITLPTQLCLLLYSLCANYVIDRFGSITT